MAEVARPEIAQGVPTPEACVALRAAAGLGARDVEAARVGLAATLHGLIARAGDEVVAMGRIVGDGGCFVQVVDMAVHPDHQGRGLGAEIGRRLLAWCEAELPPTCHVSLVSSTRAVPLYEGLGFAACRGMDRYADPARTGGMRI